MRIMFSLLKRKMAIMKGAMGKKKLAFLWKAVSQVESWYIVGSFYNWSFKKYLWRLQWFCYEPRSDSRWLIFQSHVENRLGGSVKARTPSRRWSQELRWAVMVVGIRIIVVKVDEAARLDTFWRKSQGDLLMYQL